MQLIEGLVKNNLIFCLIYDKNVALKSWFKIILSFYYKYLTILIGVVMINWLKVIFLESLSIT